MPYSAKITNVKREFSLPDNAAYLDVSFDVLLDGDKVAERRHGFPLDTPAEAIEAEVKQYCVMFENDHALAAEAAERSKAEAAAEEVANSLIGKEV